MEKARQVTEVFNKAWAQTEYNTAGLIAESTATYNRLMGQVELFPYWEYRTVGDDHVREEHRKLDGVILPANDVRWKKIYPPNGWNCRCYVVPRMQHEVAGIDIAAMRRRVDEYFETAEYKNAKAQGFGVNRAVLPQVFDENQFYIRKLRISGCRQSVKVRRPLRSMFPDSQGRPANGSIRVSGRER